MSNDLARIVAEHAAYEARIVELKAERDALAASWRVAVDRIDEIEAMADARIAGLEAAVAMYRGAHLDLVERAAGLEALLRECRQIVPAPFRHPRMDGSGLTQRIDAALTPEKPTSHE